MRELAIRLLSELIGVRLVQGIILTREHIAFTLQIDVPSDVWDAAYAPYSPKQAINHPPIAELCHICGDVIIDGDCLTCLDKATNPDN